MRAFGGKLIARSSVRQVDTQVYVYYRDGTEAEVNSDIIHSATIDMGTSRGFQVGTTYCAKLTMILADVIPVPAGTKIDYISVNVRFKTATSSWTDWLGIGCFYIDSLKQSKNLYTLIAYDKMMTLEKSFYIQTPAGQPWLSYLDELVIKKSIELASFTFPVPSTVKITGGLQKGTDENGNAINWTYREFLNQLALMNGINFFFNSEGKLDITRYDTVSDTVSADEGIEGVFSEASFTIKDVKFSVPGQSYNTNTENTDGVIEFVNNLVFSPKVSVYNAVYNHLVGIAYEDATITYHGHGWLEIGDIFTVYDNQGTQRTLLVTGIKYKLASGSFTETVYSSALSQSESNYNSGDMQGQTVSGSVVSYASRNKAAILKDISFEENSDAFSATFKSSNGDTYVNNFEFNRDGSGNIISLTNITTEEVLTLSGIPEGASLLTAEDIGVYVQALIDNDHKLPYSLLSGAPTIPAVNNGTLTVKHNNAVKGTFTANQSANTDINIETVTQTDIDDSHSFTQQTGFAIEAETAEGGVRIDEVDGYSVVVNQICKQTVSGSRNGITIRTNADDSVTASGTMTGTNTFANINYVSNVKQGKIGHKYALLGQTSDLFINAMNMGNSNNSYFGGQPGGRDVNRIFTCEYVATESASWFRFQVNDSLLNQTINITIYPEIIDLTLMFGQGNEPSTVAEFEAWRSLHKMSDYIPYTAGYIKSEGTVVDGKSYCIIKSTDNTDISTSKIPLTAPLRSIGNLKDKLVYKDGKWYENRAIGTVRLRDLQINYYDSIKRYQVRMPNDYRIPTSGEVLQIKTSRYIPNTSPVALTNIDLTISGWGSSAALYFYDFAYISASEDASISALLSAQGEVEILYPLATPTLTECVEQAAFYDLQAYEGMTYVASEDGFAELHLTTSKYDDGSTALLADNEGKKALADTEKAKAKALADTPQIHVTQNATLEETNTYPYRTTDEYISIEINTDIGYATYYLNVSDIVVTPYQDEIATASDNVAHLTITDSTINVSIYGVVNDAQIKVTTWRSLNA